MAGRMTEEELRAALATVTQRLAASAARDFARAEDDSDTESMRNHWRGRASGYRLALDSLHVWTHGEFGVEWVTP